MTPHRYGKEYVDLAMQGPFPSRIDPWAEKARYFHQVHVGMIGQFFVQLGDRLLERDYYASREVSLQIAEQGHPALPIYRKCSLDLTHKLDYTAVATALHANPGVTLQWDRPEQDAMYIKRNDGTLVTVVEVISPDFKADRHRVALYLQRRLELTHQRNVNVVELDLTRCHAHLLRDPLVESYPYHIAIYLPNTDVHFLGMSLDAPLENFALSLLDDGLLVDTHSAYSAAYQEVIAASQILFENNYAESKLPFPSLLSADERQTCLDAVAAWKAQLATLRPTDT